MFASASSAVPVWVVHVPSIAVTREAHRGSRSKGALARGATLNEASPHHHTVLSSGTGTPGDGRGQPFARPCFRQSGASSEELLDGPLSPRQPKVVPVLRPGLTCSSRASGCAVPERSSKRFSFVSMCLKRFHAIIVLSTNSTMSA